MGLTILELLQKESPEDHGGTPQGSQAEGGFSAARERGARKAAEALSVPRALGATRRPGAQPLAARHCQPGLRAPPSLLLPGRPRSSSGRRGSSWSATAAAATLQPPVGGAVLRPWRPGGPLGSRRLSRETARLAPARREGRRGRGGERVGEERERRWRPRS
ncbi:hypothetical protein AAY473_012299 [Plecturocebus cupreus]